MPKLLVNLSESSIENPPLNGEIEVDSGTSYCLLLRARCLCKVREACSGGFPAATNAIVAVKYNEKCKVTMVPLWGPRRGMG